MDALNARGETSSDILINLFKGYLAAPDKEFNMYIKQKKNNYEEGQDLMEGDIMVMAENKYKTLARSGEWNAPSREQQEILALTAKLETMTKKKKGKGNGETNKKYEWKKVPPKDLQDTKQKNGKNYHWCIKHQMWTLHKPEDCKLEGKEASKDDNLKLTAALAAIEDDEDSVE